LNEYRNYNIVRSKMKLKSNSLFFQLGTYLKYKTGQFELINRISLFRYKKGEINGMIFPPLSVTNLLRNIKTTHPSASQ
jgi:hypothetical protein